MIHHNMLCRRLAAIEKPFIEETSGETVLAFLEAFYWGNFWRNPFWWNCFLVKPRLLLVKLLVLSRKGTPGWLCCLVRFQGPPWVGSLLTAAHCSPSDGTKPCLWWHPIVILLSYRGGFALSVMIIGPAFVQHSNWWSHEVRGSCRRFPVTKALWGWILESPYCEVGFLAHHFSMQVSCRVSDLWHTPMRGTLKCVALQCIGGSIRKARHALLSGAPRPWQRQSEILETVRQKPEASSMFSSQVTQALACERVAIFMWNLNDPINQSNMIYK